MRSKKDDGLILYTEEEKAKEKEKDNNKINNQTVPVGNVIVNEEDEVKEEKVKDIQYTLDSTSEEILSVFSVTDKILKYLSDTTLSGGANTYYKDKSEKVNFYKNLTDRDERVKVKYKNGRLMLDVELTSDYSKGIYKKYDSTGNVIDGGPFSSISVLRKSKLLSTFNKAPLYVIILYGLLDENMVEELKETGNL
ncbi:hypothetical protein [Fusobacterium sp. PH5-44]|uniref:hypothetical protein n=1 Tax=Fusobacterium sp. PH5-44 TaxID=2940518 RepID=UPI003D1AB529